VFPEYSYVVQVRIDRIECTRCSLPIAEFCIECSGGTYIRRLLSDVAKDLVRFIYIHRIHG